MTTQKRILPKNIQNLLTQNWEELSEYAKNMILSLLQESDLYKNKAIKEAIKNDAEFAKKLNQYITKKRRQNLQEIEQKEQEEDLKKFNI